MLRGNFECNTKREDITIDEETFPTGATLGTSLQDLVPKEKIRLYKNRMHCLTLPIFVVQFKL